MLGRLERGARPGAVGVLDVVLDLVGDVAALAPAGVQRHGGAVLLGEVAHPACVRVADRALGRGGPALEDVPVKREAAGGELDLGAVLGLDGVHGARHALGVALEADGVAGHVPLGAQDGVSRDWVVEGERGVGGRPVLQDGEPAEELGAPHRGVLCGSAGLEAEEHLLHLGLGGAAGRLELDVGLVAVIELEHGGPVVGQGRAGDRPVMGGVELPAGPTA